MPLFSISCSFFNFKLFLSLFFKIYNSFSFNSLFSDASSSWSKWFASSFRSSCSLCLILSYYSVFLLYQSTILFLGMRSFFTDSGGMMLIFLSSSSRSKFFSMIFLFFLSTSSSWWGFLRSSKAFLKLTLIASRIMVSI